MRSDSSHFRGPAIRRYTATHFGERADALRARGEGAAGLCCAGYPSDGKRRGTAPRPRNKHRHVACIYENEKRQVQHLASCFVIVNFFTDENGG